jgi:hypothetical protein
MGLQMSLDYPWALGVINPKRVKIETLYNQNSLLSNYMYIMIDYWVDMDNHEWSNFVENRAVDNRDSTVPVLFQYTYM